MDSRSTVGDNAAGTWTGNMHDYYDWAQQKYAAAIAANPLAYKTPAQKFADGLIAVRARLDAMRAWMVAHPGAVKVDDRSRYLTIQGQYNALAAGFYAGATTDGRPAGFEPVIYTPAVGAAPLVIVAIVVGVAVVAVSIAAVAWAIATQPYLDSLLVTANTAKAELDVRAEAMRDGKTLQPTTLPQPRPDGGGFFDFLKNIPVPALMPVAGGLLLVAYLAVQTTGRR